MKNFLTQLRDGLKTLDLRHDDHLLLQYQQLVELLLKWNKQFNLTAITEPAEIITHHLLDSLSILPQLLAALPEQGGWVLDVGTGAGFPGLPLAIYCPHHTFVLLDSREKRLHFIAQVKGTLGLTNIQVVHSRIEEFSNPSPFNVIMARAVTSVPNLWRNIEKLLNSGGRLLVMKGTEAQVTAELAGWEQRVTIHPLVVPGLHQARCVVVIEKEPKHGENYSHR